MPLLKRSRYLINAHVAKNIIFFLKTCVVVKDIHEIHMLKKNSKENTPLIKTRFEDSNTPKVTSFDLKHNINPVSYPLHQRRLYGDVLI